MACVKKIGHSSKNCLELAKYLFLVSQLLSTKMSCVSLCNCVNRCKSVLLHLHTWSFCWALLSNSGVWSAFLKQMVLTVAMFLHNLDG